MTGRQCHARRATILAAGIIILAGVAAYSNSLSGPFIFDDHPAIVDNPTIRRLLPIWKPLCPPGTGISVSGRPVLNLSLALDFAVSGFHVRGYHVTNLAIHLVAALLLFGIVRRTVCKFSEQLPELAASKTAVFIALAVALLWAVHPLQTESVTYIVQRAESLMGLFYLLTLYCFLHGADSKRAILCPPRSSEIEAAAGTVRSMVGKDMQNPTSLAFGLQWPPRRTSQ